MPGLVQNNDIDIQTTLPSVEPVGTNQTSISPQVIQSLGNLGTSLYRQYAVGAAQSEAQEVLQQFDSDLQVAEQQGTTDAFMQSQLQTITKESPEYQGVVNQLNKLSAAERQGTAPKLLLQLRAEAALKRSLNRAPGLRNEIRQAARDTLGFDPSGALINALLNSKDSDASQAAKDLNWAARQDFQFLQSNPEAGPAVFKPDGGLDFSANRQKVIKYQGIQASQNTIKEASERAAITEVNKITEFEQTVTEGLSLQFSALTDGVANVLSSVRTIDQLRAARPELEQNLQLLRQSANSYIDRQFNSLRTTGEATEALQAARERVRENALGGIQGLLDAEDFTIVEQNVALLQTLQNDLKMNFVDANQTLAYVQQNMPGFIQSVYPTILARDIGTQDRIRDLVQAGLQADPDFLRQVNMRNHLDSLADVRAFEGMSSAERRSVAASNYVILEQAVQNIDRATSSPTSINTLGNAYATVAQLIDPSNTEDTRRSVDLMSDPRFVTLVDKMVQSENGEVTQEVVADSAVASLIGYVRNAGLPDISSGEVNTSNMRYNYDTGKLEITGQDQTVARGVQTDPTRPATPRVTRGIPRASRETANRVNRAIDAVYNMRQYDPSISNMSRAEIAQTIVGGRLGDIPTVGTPVAIQAPQAEQQQQQRVDLNTTIREVRDGLVNLSQQLQGSEAAASIEELRQQLESLSSN